MVVSLATFLAYASTTVVVIFSLFYAYAKYKHSYWRKRGVKTPPIHILFGNFIKVATFKMPPGQLLQEIYESASPDDPYIGMYIFHKPALLLRDINLIKQLLVKDFDVFSNRTFGSVNQKDSVGLTNLLSIQHPNWKYLRTKITPSLTGQKLKRMLPLMLECGNPMVDYIERASGTADGWKEFELKNICSRYTTDVIASLAFGVTTNSFDEKDTAFWEAGMKVLSGTKRGIILLTCFFLPGIAKLIEPLTTEPSKFFRRVFWDSMNTREKVGNNRGDLIEALLNLKNGEQNPNFKLEGDNLLAQAVAFYVAGFEASSTAITFVLFELARHPEYEARVYEEISTIIAKDGLTVESINEMTFLDAVVRETLRLYPPLPVVDRMPLRDYKVPGHDLIIEKGVTVYVAINGTNQDPKCFTNPKEFNPHRSKDETSDIRGSLAFGVGPRSCVGQRMGTLLTKVAIITILRQYTVSYRQDKHNILSPGTIFTTAVDGVYVQLKKRTNKST